MTPDTNALALAAVIRAIRTHDSEIAASISRELEAARQEHSSAPRAVWLNSDPFIPLIAAAEGR